VLELVEKYGKENYHGAIEDYFEYADKVSLAGLKKLTPKIYESSQHIIELGLDFHVKITVEGDKFTVDLRNNPD